MQFDILIYNIGIKVGVYFLPLLKPKKSELR